jgi:small subunit ribosomal protein S16
MRRMLTIRLQRRGRKNDPSFRVLVLDSKSGPKTGKYLEMVGSYDARTNRVELQAERIKHWMGHGAQVSDTVHNLLVSNGIVEGKKRNVLPKKTVAKADPVAAEASAPAEAAPAASEAPAQAEPEAPASAEAEEKPAE